MHEYDDCTTSIGQPIVCSCVLCLRDSQSALSQLGFMGWQRHVPRDNDPDALTELLSEVQENPSLMGRGQEDEDMYSVTDGLLMIDYVVLRLVAGFRQTSYPAVEAVMRTISLRPSDDMNEGSAATISGSNHLSTNIVTSVPMGA